MTVKLWMLSMIISFMAPFIFKKPSKSIDQEATDPYYQPGSYFEHTMSLSESKNFDIAEVSNSSQPLEKGLSGN